MVFRRCVYRSILRLLSPFLVLLKNRCINTLARSCISESFVVGTRWFISDMFTARLTKLHIS
ncbi:hypothetical protein LINPERPRIM_LOCUS7304 [Linum perenne]